MCQCQTQVYDVRISEAQRQLVCETLSLYVRQDSAPPHKAEAVRNMLTTLLNRPSAPLKVAGVGVNCLV
jgi:hypothetical protein